MKRATITLPDDLADLVDREALRCQASFSEVVRQLIVRGLSGADEKSREIPWAGLFEDPKMVPAERMDGELAAHWAHELARDRG
jgi:Arc/MetJ-type ribon-helix-helix transcriptional regulator